MMYKKLVWLIGLLAMSAIAQETANTPIEAPPPPPQLQSGEVLEPEVTIIETEEEKIYEYRVDGKLYMVKVTPSNGGKPYYFIDTDGDGDLDRQEGASGDDVINLWKLFEF